MPLFSMTVTDDWQARFLSGETLYQDDVLVVTANTDLPHDRRIMLLKTFDGNLMVVLTPALADRLRLNQRPSLSESILRSAMDDAGVRLHGAEYLFYFSEAARDALLQENTAATVRRLTEHDAAVFSAFQAAASEDDLDAAYVELDHWAVFGSFEQQQLACAASMYPWRDTPFADLGVLTLPPFRGKGHARAVVRAICRYAAEQGYEPQYRCQVDNHLSASLAAAAGLTLFGTWDVISPESTD